MDRFIDNYLKITLQKLMNLKSNMDRFIALQGNQADVSQCYLKSNMDRFIASAQYKETNGDVNLKSNMDRFIA